MLIESSLQDGSLFDVIFTPLSASLLRRPERLPVSTKLKSIGSF